MVVGETVQEANLVVIGAGPGGYTAALRSRELGISTTLVDVRPEPGGVCLHEGCIPSKALLHAAEVINTSKSAAQYGLYFAPPEVRLDELRSWKEAITHKLAQGVLAKCKSNKVEVIQGEARFLDANNLRIESLGQNPIRLNFKKAILASGSRPLQLPNLFATQKDMESPRVLTAALALQLAELPRHLLVIGGGYIGLEMGTVYAALGCEVTIVEMTDGLLPGVDRDLVKPLANHLQTAFKNVFLNTKASSLQDTGDGIECHLEGPDAPALAKFDRVLIAVGRRPNSDNLGLSNTQVVIDEHGFVKIDEYCRSKEPNIYAIGDVSGQPMLAHRAMRQGRVAAEHIAGLKSVFDNRAIPAVVFTEPEIAWCGMTENEARARNLAVGVAKFPWSASGRAMTLAEPIGHTKIIYSPDSTLVLGVGIVGPRAGELIAEAVLAIELGAVLEDLSVTIHPHPTLSETIAESSDIAIARQERQKQAKSASLI